MAALRQGADLLEFRLDYLQDPQDIDELALPREIKVPTIATLRREREGGRYQGPEESRWQVLQSVAGKFDYLDLEYGFANPERVGKIHGAGSNVIVSHHDLKKTPPRDDMLSLLFRARAAGGNVLKIATRARSHRDVLNLLTLPMDISPIVVIPMGAKGRTGRILAPLLGSEFAYATIDGLPPVAPGMLSVGEMRQVYDTIEKATS
jgi:3-dehydroquinate dehydratase-1